MMPIIFATLESTYDEKQPPVNWDNCYYLNNNVCCTIIINVQVIAWIKIFFSMWYAVSVS